AALADRLQTFLAAAGAEHANAVRVRDLRRGQADAACRAVDQHGLAGFRLRFVEERAIRRRVRHAHRRALAERDAGGQTIQVIEIADGLLRVRAAVVAVRVFGGGPVDEHAVAGLPALHVRADRFDFTARVRAGNE